MKEQFKQTFDPMVAPVDLVAKTKSSVLSKMESSHKKPIYLTRLIVGLTTLIFLMGGGYWLYFIPVVTISVDINPSIELFINRLDRVIEVKAYNDDGQTIIDNIDVTNDTYTQALNELLADTTISTLLSNNGKVDITVVGNDHDHCINMIETINTDVSCLGHMQCHHGNATELQQAHEHGLSYGKYAMYQQLIQYYPDLTIEQVQNMTMRELNELLQAKIGNNGFTTPGNGYTNGNGYGNGSGNTNDASNGYGYGNSNDDGQGHHGHSHHE